MECHGGRAEERAQSRAGNPLEPSRAANAPSQDGEPRTDCEDEPATEIRDAARTKGSDPKRGSSYVANRLAEEPPRLAFHIPRRNKEKRGAFILPLCLGFWGLIWFAAFGDLGANMVAHVTCCCIQLASSCCSLTTAKKNLSGDLLTTGR